MCAGDLAAMVMWDMWVCNAHDLAAMVMWDMWVCNAGASTHGSVIMLG